MLRKRQNKKTGDIAEQLAKGYLQKNKLTYVQSNYHCRQGEIDLVMMDREQLVFVEVKYRHKISHGSALESVTPQKQQKIIHTAKHYLHRYNLTETTSCRFDVVSINYSMDNARIVWIKNAF